MELFDEGKMTIHLEQQLPSSQIWELHNQCMLGNFRKIHILLDSLIYEKENQISLSLNSHQHHLQNIQNRSE